VIPKEEAVFSFGPEMKPVLEVDPGAVVTFETHDCFSGQIQPESDLVTEIDFSKVNPATGPVAVRSVEIAGDLLTLHLLRNHSSLGHGSRQKVGREGGFSRRALGQATDYIIDNLARKLTLAEIAGVAHMSPHRFTRSFKAATGLSPHQYVIHKRVDRAKTLLSDTGLTVAEGAQRRNRPRLYPALNRRQRNQTPLRPPLK
jgi:AraC-like DNA-binding protein